MGNSLHMMLQWSVAMLLPYASLSFAAVHSATARGVHGSASIVRACLND
jgi:hypothetical protein